MTSFRFVLETPPRGNLTHKGAPCYPNWPGWEFVQSPRDIDTVSQPTEDAISEVLACLRLEDASRRREVTFMLLPSTSDVNGAIHPQAARRPTYTPFHAICHARPTLGPHTLHLPSAPIPCTTGKPGYVCLVDSLAS